MKNPTKLTTLAICMGVSGAAYAGTYTMPLSVQEITLGSTGNLYVYPWKELAFERRISTTGYGGADEVETILKSAQSIANPAGCSNPSRVVLENDHPLFSTMVEALNGGGGYYGGGSNFQFYISSSKCAVGSPTMDRMRTVDYGALREQAGCDPILDYNYASDGNDDTQYDCNSRGRLPRD